MKKETFSKIIESTTNISLKNKTIDLIFSLFHDDNDLYTLDHRKFIDILEKRSKISNYLVQE
jgi:hypothetical protein